MRILVAGLRLVDEVQASLERDEGFQERQMARARLQHAVQLSFLATTLSLRERDLFTEDDCRVLLEGLRELVPVAVDSFTPDFRNELQVRLGMQIKEEKDPTQARIGNDIIEMLESGATKPGHVAP